MIEVIYRNNDLVVVVKPYGALSEYDPKRENVPAMIAEALGIAHDSVYTVHRLDATTEGLMVYALNKSSAAALSRAIDNDEFKKKYVAFITRDPSLGDSGEMSDNLYFDRNAQKSYVVSDNKKNAKKVLLAYHLGDAMELNGHIITPAFIELKTGRTHQIRAQFSSRKSPLVGDGKYGSRINHKGPSLFSVSVSFPYKGEIMTFEREADFSF